MKSKLKLTNPPTIDQVIEWLEDQAQEWAAETSEYRDTERDYDHGGGFNDIGVSRDSVKLKLKQSVLEVIIMPWGLQFYGIGDEASLLTSQIKSWLLKTSSEKNEN